MSDSQWKASDIFKIVVNPAYAGIGPFDMYIEGEWIKDSAYPALITDEQWLKTQRANVLESGARAVLLGMRREVLKCTGVKVDKFYQNNWLEDCISRIKRGKIEEVFIEILNTLRPKVDLSVSEPSRIINVDVTEGIMREIRQNPLAIHTLTLRSCTSYSEVNSRAVL